MTVLKFRLVATYVLSLRGSLTSPKCINAWVPRNILMGIKVGWTGILSRRVGGRCKSSSLLQTTEARISLACTTDGTKLLVTVSPSVKQHQTLCSGSPPCIPILGDPGADSGDEEKSKRAEKYMARRKVKNGEKSPWRQCLTRPVPNGSYFSSCHIFSTRLDFSLSPLSAPGSPRMCIPGFQYNVP